MGKACWGPKRCNGQQGPCAFCGWGGMCCRKGHIGNGCDGFMGKERLHICVRREGKIGGASQRLGALIMYKRTIYVPICLFLQGLLIVLVWTNSVMTLLSAFPLVLLKNQSTSQRKKVTSWNPMWVIDASKSWQIELIVSGIHNAYLGIVLPNIIPHAKRWESEGDLVPFHWRPRLSWKRKEKTIKTEIKKNFICKCS